MDLEVGEGEDEGEVILIVICSGRMRANVFDRRVIRSDCDVAVADRESFAK